MGARVAAAPTASTSGAVFGVAITARPSCCRARPSDILIDEGIARQRGGLGAGVLLEPHNEHIVLAPVLIWKVIQTTIGMDSVTPYLSRRSWCSWSVSCCCSSIEAAGRALAGAAGAVPVLFLGAAWEDLLSPFQIGYFGSMACGLGMLLALDRGGRRDGRLAAVLLTLA